MLTVEFELNGAKAEKISLTGKAVRVFEGEIDYYKTGAFEEEIDYTKSQSESGKVCSCGGHSH